MTPAELGSRLSSGQLPVICVHSRLFVYGDGCYREAEQFIGLVCQRHFGTKWTSSKAEQVAEWLRIHQWVDPATVDPPGLVNVRNGLLDPKTGQLHPHTPKHLSIIQLPTDFEPAAYCPRVDQFLNEVTRDPQERQALEELAGYCLAPDCRFQKALALTGQGENGKSILLELLQQTLGEENLASEGLQDLARNRFRAANLVGKLANIGIDLPRTAVEDGSTFKALVAGELIPAERKFGHSFAFRNRAKLLFSANEMPSSRDRSHGYFRRWIIVEFPFQFVNNPRKPNERKKDPNLRDALFTDNGRSYMLRLLVEGYQRLINRGYFKETAHMQEMLGQYRRDSDHVRAFLEEECVIEPDGEVTKDALFQAYKTYCEDQGIKYVLQQAQFFKALRGQNLGITESRPAAGAEQRRRVLSGISLR